MSSPDEYTTFDISESPKWYGQVGSSPSLREMSAPKSLRVKIQSTVPVIPVMVVLSRIEICMMPSRASILTKLLSCK